MAKRSATSSSCLQFWANFRSSMQGIAKSIEKMIATLLCIRKTLQSLLPSSYTLDVYASEHNHYTPTYNATSCPSSSPLSGMCSICKCKLYSYALSKNIRPIHMSLGGLCMLKLSILHNCISLPINNPAFAGASFTSLIFLSLHTTNNLWFAGQIAK